MSFGDTEMCLRRNNITLTTILDPNVCRSEAIGMEYELDWAGHHHHSSLVSQKMQAFVSGKKRVVVNHGMSFSKESLDLGSSSLSENFRDEPLIPGLSDDVAKLCLALVPRASFPSMGRVCKKWRYVVQSKEFITVRRLAGMLEERLYVLTMNAGGKESHWEVMDCQGHGLSCLPPMPGPAKTGFKVVVVDGKLLVIAGCAMINGSHVASSDVYQFDTCLNSWSKLAHLKEARYDFACAEVNGLVYVVGGHGVDGESLSSAEVYDLETGIWTFIESLRRSRWGCFASGFNGKLYVMGGRSNFTIGNSKLVDVYNPQCGSWCSNKNGVTMVTAHVEVGKKLYCIDWKNQRKMSVFNAEDETWEVVDLPLSGSSRAGFQFGKLSGKLLLFSSQEETGHSTLLYDPDAAPGKQWKTTEIKLSDTGSQVCSLLWSDNERELLSSHGFTQNQLTLWKYPSMVKMAELSGHTSKVLYMAQSPDGCTVASAAGDETLRFWNVFGVPEAAKKPAPKAAHEPFSHVNRIR